MSYQFTKLDAHIMTFLTMIQLRFECKFDTRKIHLTKNVPFSDVYDFSDIYFFDLLCCDSENEV